MILADSSVWIAHFRISNNELLRLVEDGELAGHPLLTAELTLGSLPDRERTLRRFQRLPQLPAVSLAEVRMLVETRRLWNRGVGFFDVSFLVACLLAGARLWTRDRRLTAIARELNMAWPGEA